MLPLKLIEDKFELLSLRLKIEMFLFPLIILLVIGYLLYEKEETRIKLPNMDIKEVKMQDSFVDILKQIETYSSKNNLLLESIKRSDDSIELEVFSSFDKLNNFLVFVENFNSFSKIEYMQLSEDKLIIEISFKKFYQKALYKEENLKEQPSIKDLKIKAIVDKEVLIENKWLKTDDKYSGFSVVAIMPNSIVLKKDDKQIQVKLYKDERF